MGILGHTFGVFGIIVGALGPFLEAGDHTFEDLVVFGNIFGAEYEKFTECHTKKYDIGRFLEVQKCKKNMFFLNIDFFMKKHDLLRIVLAP